MSEQNPRPESVSSSSLPEKANLEWLRKEAKRRRDEMRKGNANATLSEAQFELAKEYGFSSWRAMKARVDSLTIDGQMFAAARAGDVGELAKLLDELPEKLLARERPYEWTLLHAAAHKGQLACVELLLSRGAEVNAREKGDNTYAMHWAAAAGHLEVVRRLSDAGGDVVGAGDDHALELIGWATGWDGCDLATRRAVAKFLVSRGARHHIFSAIALNDAEEVRRVVARDRGELERRLSHNEDFQRPLHFAVRKGLAEMVGLLVELGADPLGRDASGNTAAAYATSPEIDRPVMEAIARSGRIDLVTAVALGEWEAAGRMLRAEVSAAGARDFGGGVLHLMAKRGDVRAVKWLIERGVDVNGRWAHWDAVVTPLHLAAWGGSAEVVRILLDAGADPSVRDSKHEGDAVGWAEHFGRAAIVEVLKGYAKCA